MKPARGGRVAAIVGAAVFIGGVALCLYVVVRAIIWAVG